MKEQINVLLVEDELSLAMLIKENLESKGYEVCHAENGDLALKSFFQEKPDLVILDIMMPKVNGFNVAKTIRNTDRKTPVLFLTAKVQVKDVVKGFESGGNDYIRKPFSMDELLVRMKVLLGNDRLIDVAEESDQVFFELGAYLFDSRKFILKTGNKIIAKLTSRESELLKLLCQNENQILTKKSILLKVWDDDSFFNSRSLDVFISRLRKHFKEEPKVNIINIRGVGYKLLVD